VTAVVTGDGASDMQDIGINEVCSPVESCPRIN